MQQDAALRQLQHAKRELRVVANATVSNSFSLILVEPLTFYLIRRPAPPRMYSEGEVATFKDTIVQLATRLGLTQVFAFRLFFSCLSDTCGV